MQLHVKLTRRKQNSYTEGIYIFEIDLRKTVGDDLRQRIEFKHDFNSKEVVVISASGNTVIKENEVEMLLKVHTTVTAAAAITSDINKELYLSFGVIEKIVREHFEENQKLLNNWVKETDFLQDKTYVSETNILSVT